MFRGPPRPAEGDVHFDEWDYDALTADDGETVVKRDQLGIVSRNRKSMGAIPQFIRFPVETRGVDLAPPKQPGDFSRYLREMLEGAVIDSECGTAGHGGAWRQKQWTAELLNVA